MWDRITTDLAVLEAQLQTLLWVFLRWLLEPFEVLL
jgi:hypothetical protein